MNMPDVFYSLDIFCLVYDMLGGMWSGVEWCGVVWCGVVWCGVVWCSVVWCGVVWCMPSVDFCRMFSLMISVKLCIFHIWC